ncbi:cysteine desulfurase family protein [Limnochorda pilosa]|uniref:cysteine desulfurase n=1 Tax=Limnochorda pilosa TaxID=1555112 RepID=A0A0K2SKL5_LIMPI|nr:cysteine desulfurase family protein [Limnochorda pilosa]BAS27562.1 cysteine desulfurase [Limnochorda pilosa]
MRAYLDHSATTPPDPEVIGAMVEAMSPEGFGNPSSLHRLGVEAERKVRRAREQVAALLEAAPDEIVFTSGGTEANNLAAQGGARARARRGRHVLVSAVEHPSVREAAGRLADEGFRVEEVPVDREGRVLPDRLAERLRDDTVLVSVMRVNNELGTVQPVEELVRVVKERCPEALFHVDAIQAAGLTRVTPRAWGCDLLSVSAHKLHGPKGVGALWIRPGVRLIPLVRGGGQERDLRPGTENVPGIVGFGRAAELALSRRGEAPRVAQRRRRLEEGIRSRVPGVRRLGPEEEHAAPHILNLAFAGLRGEVLVHGLEAEEVYVSTGSACSSRHTGPSHVLAALGEPQEAIEGAIRFSLSPLTTEAEVDQAIDAVARTVAELRAMIG